MSVYFPQAAVALRVRWEDFGDKTNEKLKQTYLLNVLAKSVKVTINDYATADTFECEIDYKNFPFDPRCIRACGVVIAMQDSRQIFLEDNSLNPLQITKENTIFIGFADDESITFDDTKRVVKLEGRDQTSILIDRKYLAGTLNLEQPLDIVIRGLLDGIEETKPMPIENRTGEVLPTLSKFWADKSQLSGQKNVQHDQSYWDVIQDIVARAGLIAYVEIDRLVVTRPRALYDINQSKRFVYGKNLKNLEYKRKLGRRKNFNIAVRSLNVETKEVLQALIPKEATEAWAKETGIANLEIKTPETNADGTPKPEDQLKPAPYISFRIPDVADKDHLIKVGQEIYEEIGRQQIEGTFSTSEMRISWLKEKGKGAIEQFDILKLRNGTPVLIEVDQGDLEGLNTRKTRDDRERFLLSRGYNPKVAGALADTLSNPRIGGPLYTKAVTYSMDAERGFSCQVEFINFIQTAKAGQ